MDLITIEKTSNNHQQTANAGQVSRICIDQLKMFGFPHKVPIRSALQNIYGQASLIVDVRNSDVMSQILKSIDIDYIDAMNTYPIYRF